MTVFYNNASIRETLLGINVSRTEAVLPQGTTGNIFTVSGGRIIVISLLGEVTTVMAGVSTTLKVGFTPTTGAYDDWCAASADLTGAAVGTHVTLPTAKATALVTDLTKGNGVIGRQVSWIAPIGNITLTTVGSNTTGKLKWDLIYVPLDVASAVVAA